jgi:hypothetical protein
VRLVGERYSGHSPRRGFATWSNRNQWSPEALMNYMGWRDVHSALRYVHAGESFGDWRLATGDWRRDGAPKSN